MYGWSLASNWHDKDQLYPYHLRIHVPLQQQSLLKYHQRKKLCERVKLTWDGKNVSSQTVEVRKLFTMSIPPLERVNTVKRLGLLCELEVFIEFRGSGSRMSFLPIATGEADFLR
jgi:hypothetical protein